MFLSVILLSRCLILWRRRQCNVPGLVIEEKEEKGGQVPFLHFLFVIGYLLAVFMGSFCLWWYNE